MIAVKKNEQPSAVVSRHDEDLLSVAMRQPTVEREADEFRAARRVVGLSVAATGGERRGDHG